MDRGGDMQGNEDVSFISFICPVLGAITGLLIAIPASSIVSSQDSLASFASLALILLLTCAGGAVGYRRRASREFFYFTLVAILVLSALVYDSLWQ